MSTTPTNATSCCCNNQKQQDLKENESAKKSKYLITLKTLPSIVLSILIAFFPKCPLCWAAYMSLFGFLGLSQLPFMGWLLPVLLAFLGAYLFVLYKKSKTNGILPFRLSVIGAMFLFVGKILLPQEKWIAIAGILFIIASSLWLSFAPIWIEYFMTKQNKTITN